MAKAIQCECGFVARGDSADEVVEHHRGAHPRRPSRPRRKGDARRPPGLDRRGLIATDEEVSPCPRRRGAVRPRRATRPPRASSGSRPPSPGIAGARRWRPGWARRPRRCSTWPGSRRARACSTSPRAPAGRRWRRRAGSATDGAVLATDLAPAHPRLRRARGARRRASTNVAVRAMDAEALDVEPGSVRRGDLPARADVPARRCPPRWRACAARCVPAGGWRRSSSPRPTATASSASRWGSSAAAPDSARRSPGSRARSASAPPACSPARCAAAGFGASRCERVDAPLRLPAAADCLRFEQESFGALHQMLAGLDDAGRAAAWDEVGDGAGATSRGPRASRARASCWWSARRA